ncbi:hypothetical protein [Nocardioides sp. SYSU D00038]|uniref:hypothetical protein n=1 Tax=Nocardioides sp. SYSU D00038 TaxID=2812554 RepID=UPI001968A125|nr:hypothetical protein [Nocardioides sp. SYSU D00038]
MSDKPLPRPGQATLAGWMVVVGSVLVVVSAFERLGSLRSLETQEAIEEFLAEPPADGLGLSLQDVTSLLHVLVMVTAGLATASAILGWYALRRSRSARLALGVLAGPLFLAGLSVSGLMPAIVAASVVVLWFQPARDWFDGVSRPEPPTAPVERRPVWPPEQPPAGEEPWRSAPPPTGPGLPPVAGPPQPPSVTGSQARPVSGFGETRPTWPATPGPARRPASVVWACFLTWAFSVTAALVLTVSVVWILSDTDRFLAEMVKQEPELLEMMSRSMVVTSVVATLVGLIVAVVVVSGFAVLVWRGVPWARLALTISAALGAVGSLVLLVGAVAMVVPLVGAAAILMLMLRPDTAAWFDRR